MKNATAILPALIDRPHVAARLGIGETTVRGLRLSGALHPVLIGRRVLYHIAEVDALAERLAIEAGVSKALLAVGAHESSPLEVDPA